MGKHRLVISIGDAGMEYLRRRCAESGARSPATVAVRILDSAAQLYQQGLPQKQQTTGNIADEIQAMFAEAADTESPQYGSRTRQTKNRRHD